MGIERVEATYTVTGPILEITPETVKDNSNYQIKIAGITSLDGKKTYPPQIITITTAASPMYCSLASMKAVTSGFEIPDSVMISYIRDASKYADFVAGGTAVKKTDKTVPFAVEQFVRTKATLDCLLNSYMTKTTSGGGSYTLGDAEVQDPTNSTAFRGLIKALQDALKMWTDAIRGYYNEGRVKPQVTRVGLKASENSDVSQITIDTILNDMSRSATQFS